MRALRALRRVVFGLALFQALSTVLGTATLVLRPQWYERALEGTLFEGLQLVAAVVLAVVVGGSQWVALGVHLRRPQWLHLGHLVAAVVMIGWIAVECLILDSFIWPHALWGGLAVAQVLVVTLLLGALRPQPALAPSGAAEDPQKDMRTL